MDPGGIPGKSLIPIDWKSSSVLSKVLSEAYSRPDPPLSEGWKGYMVMAHAIVDPQAAYQEALQLSSYDDGNTKSNTLWWIATRPGAGGGPTPSPGPTTATTPTTTAGPTTTPVKGCCGEFSMTDNRLLSLLLLSCSLIYHHDHQVYGHSQWPSRGSGLYGLWTGGLPPVRGGALHTLRVNV